MIPAVVGSMGVVGVQTRRALLHPMCDLKAAQVNVQHSLIREIMHYKLRFSRNTAKVTKSICCAKGEATVGHRTTTRWRKKFFFGRKNFDLQAKSSRPKTVDFDSVL